MTRKITAMMTAMMLLGMAASADSASFVSRLLRLDESAPEGYDTEILSTTEAIAIDEGVTGGPGDYVIDGTNYRVAEVVNGHLTPEIDFAGWSGFFSANHPYPNGVSDSGLIDDFLVSTAARVTVPAGTWQIAFGSDDGGMLRLAGAIIVDRFNEDGGPGAIDELWFESPRGPEWTGGSITLNAPQSYALAGLFFERGGGDFFEIAIRDASGGENIEVLPENGWALLRDGQMGWGVAIPEPSTLFLLATGALGLLAYAWRRRRR